MPPAQTPNMIVRAWRITRSSIATHKVISVIVLLALCYGGYRTYAAFATPSTTPKYVTSLVATGTVVASMSETGQVSASSNIDVNSKSSGEVLSLPVVAGQHVSAGQAIAYLDSTSAKQSLTSAQQSLEAAQLSLASTQGDLSQTRTSAYNDVSTAFLGLPNVMSGLDSVLHDSTVPGHTAENNLDAYANMTKSYNSSISDERSAAESSYTKAYSFYITALADFKATPHDATDAQLNDLIKEASDAVANIADALRATSGFLDSVNTALTNQQVNPPSTLSGHISTVTGYINTVSGYVTSLSKDTTSVAGSAGATSDPLTIQSSKLSVEMKELAVTEAQQALDDTVVRAPFSGTVGKLDVQLYQTIGNGTAVATLVSDNQSVNISVNEVDAAKLKVGQKATITFDALPKVSIAGTVSSVNSVGTVSSGVVSYSAVVTFDTPNEQVKPGMSATADIVTGTESGLVVAKSAVKTQNGQSYVQIFSPPLPEDGTGTGVTSPIAPTRVVVTTGLSDNTNIIVESGLQAGAQIVTQTQTSGSTATQSSAARSTSVFGGGGASGRGGAGVFGTP